MSCPAKAGHPVLRGTSGFAQCPPRSTGSPAFAGDDSESGARLAVVPIHVSNSGRAFAFSRRISPEFCFSRALVETRAQGRPGAGWHPQVRAPQKMHTGWTTGLAGSPGLPCANGFNGVLRALPGERCTIAPVASRMADARVRSDRNITARLDAQTPGVRTTRLLRPRTSSLGIREVACARSRSHAKTLSAPGRMRKSHCSRCPALQCQSRPTPSRPSLPGLRFVTIAIRPLSQARVFRMYDKSEFR